MLASVGLWATDVVWDFTDRTATSFTSNKSYSFMATDGTTEMRYSAGSSDAIIAKNGTTAGYLKENGTTGSGTVKDIDETTNVGKTRLIRLFVSGRGKLTINCNASQKGKYKVLNGSSSGTTLISALGADTASATINVTTSPIWIETTTKGYITSIVWTPAVKYTVTYDLDGGLYDGSSTAPTQAAVASGTSINMPALTPTKDDHNFLGWTCSVDAADYAAGAAYTMTAANTTFTAHWVSTSAATHTISYTETKGADNSTNPTEYTEGVGIASFEPLADVTDFHFTGWSPASISSSATTDQTIEAQWVDAYNVTFSAGEGTGSIPSSFQKWATATFELPGQGEMVAPDGKAFDGWKDQDAASFAEGDTYTMPAKAVTLTAQWVDIYMVTFNLQEHGEAIDKQDIVSGRKATKPADPFAVGYIFDGWYKEEACTNEWDFENDVVTEDTELFAKWTSFTVNATIIFATSGAAPTAKNDAALLAEGSNGGVVTFVGAKDNKYNESFAYTSSGLALQKGGADSVKVVLNSTLQAGSYIQLDMTSANSGARGLRIQKGKDSNVYNASWTASAAGEHNIITYKVTSSDGLAGKNTFWLARNNTVYLKQIIIGNWYVEPTALDNAAEAVKAQKFIENGQMFIQKDGKIYNVMGMEIR